MKSVLVVNAFSARNAGDAAIVLATANLIRSRRAGTPRVSTRYYQQDSAFYREYGIDTVPPIIPFAPPGESSDLRRLLQLAVALMQVALVTVVCRLSPPMGAWLAERWKASGLRAALEADAVVMAGGGYLYSHINNHRPNLSLVHHLMTVKVACSLGRRVVMMPQSIGPLARRTDRTLVRWALAGVKPVVVRDLYSLEECRQTFPERQDIVLCPDIAFYGLPSRTSGRGPTTRFPSTARIGIVVMDWTWARAGRRAPLARYQEELTAAIDAFLRRGYDVELLGHARMPEQNQDDLEVARAIVRQAGGGKACSIAVGDEVQGPEDLVRVFGTCDVVIGTRLHSCILAMLAGTIAVGLGYQPKTSGTYRLLGLDDLCFDVEEFTGGALAAVVTGILENCDRYAERVRTAVDHARSEIERCYDGLHPGEDRDHRRGLRPVVPEAHRWER